MPLQDISEYLKATKDVLDILKSLGGLLPKGEDANAAQRRLGQAEDALRASEAQLAKALDYHLCQCTFPPQIMLSKGYHEDYNKEFFECPECKKQTPSQKWFEQQVRVTQHNQSSGPTWGPRRRGR